LCNLFIVSENPLTKEERINILEEKLKAMSDVKITSTFKQTFQGGSIDMKVDHNNRRKYTELMPQSRRPIAYSKAFEHLVQAGIEEPLPKKGGRKGK
jgi:hypothetical protein